MSQQAGTQSQSLSQNEKREAQLKTRKRIRGMQNEFADNKTSYLNSEDGAKRLKELSDKQSSLFDEVTETREAAMDSTLFKDTAKSMNERAKKAASNNTKQMSFARFGRAMSEKFHDAEGETQKTMDWLKIGHAALKLFQRAPNCQFMLGPIDAGSTAKKRMQKERAVREEGAATATYSQVEKLGEHADGESRPDNAHEQQISVISKHLTKHATSKHVGLYEFAVDPKSFAQTVENLFALGFLIKEGMAEHTVDEEGRQLIRAKPKAEKGEDQPARVANVLKFGYGDFER